MTRWLTLACLTFLSLLVSSTIINAQQPGTDTLEVQKVPELSAWRINPNPPTIDGSLNDDVWANTDIEITDYFTQQEPDEGKAPSESTKVAVAYDDEAVYVAFWCYDSEPEKISRQLVRRDREAESDNVTVCIDAFHDHQTCFRFEVSAAGVQKDTRIYKDDTGDPSWDAVWMSGVKIQPWGWSAEMKIPYYCLRFAEKEEHIWGINFTRNINRKDEYLKWSYVPTSKSGFTSKFGHLKNLYSISPKRHLELLPYAVSGGEFESKSAGNPDGRDLRGNIGFDAKYSISSNLILDATVNPDFGQVELDEPVLNLSTYETFYPEKRPFFLEGADLFETDYMLFYSRRIGKSLHTYIHGVDDNEYIYYTDFPDATTIIGATKLTGKLAERTSIAFLNAVTQKEIAEYDAETNVVLDSTWNGTDYDYETISADTVHREGIVQPQANYSVLRIKQDMLKNSYIGGMLTLVSQESYHPAMTGGFDWRLRTNNNIWGTNGQIVFSRVDNENVGYGFDLTLEKVSGKHVRGSTGITIKDPHLSINRLGYTSRNDTRHLWSWVQYRTNDDWWIFRNTYNNLNFYTSWNFDGINYQLGGNYNAYIEFINFWSWGGGIEFQGEKYNDLETRGNGVWEYPNNPTVSWWFSLDTDQRRKLSFNWNPGGGTDRNGTWWANYVGLEYRPQGNMEFNAGCNFVQNRGVLRWVENDGATNPITSIYDTLPVFGELDRDQIYLHASASLVLNRNLSLQLSAEGLVSGLDYRNYRYYLGDNTYSGTLSDYNHDYNYSSLNSMFLLRWEYLPGSTLYLVWTRTRPEVDDTVNNLDLKRDFKRMFSDGAQNILLIKTSYWMSI